MRLRRSAAFQAAGSASARVGGKLGGKSFHPAWATEPAAGRRSAPMYQRSTLRESSRTCGTKSPHFFDTREVHKSGGSMMWVSTSMTLNRSAIFNSESFCVGRGQARELAAGSMHRPTRRTCKPQPPVA